MVTTIAAIILVLSIISVIPASAYGGIILALLAMALITTLVRIARDESPL